MLFIVIESFKGNIEAVGERFRQRGRMLPEGVVYHASWIEPNGSRCFQVMEAPTREALDAWIERWRDLVDFEVISVLTSTDYWQTK